MQHCCLTVNGIVPGNVLADVRRRFGVVDVEQVIGRTEIRLRVVDQAALRALLDVMWDASVDVLGVALDPQPSAGGEGAALRSSPGSGPGPRLLGES